MRKFTKALTLTLLCVALISCSTVTMDAIPSGNPPDPQTVSPTNSPTLLPQETVTATPTPTPITTPSPDLKPEIVQIEAGYKALYLLLADGTLWAWGNNEYGQIGDGTHDTCTRFKKILDNVKKLTPNYMAIRNDDTLWAWGGDHLIPYQLDTSVLDANKTYVLKKDGTLWAYGSRFFALGDGVPADSNSKKTIPYSKKIKILDGVKSIPISGFASAAVKADGTLWVWGDCRLYNSTAKDYRKAMKSGIYPASPVKVLNEVKDAVFLDGWHSGGMLALKNDGTVLQWGWYNLAMKSFPFLPINFDNPLIPGYPDIQESFPYIVNDIAASNHFFAVLEDGRLVTWGYDDRDSPDTARLQAMQDKDGPIGWEGPNQLATYKEIAQDILKVAAGNETLLALKKDGTLLAAGRACYDPSQPGFISDSQTLAPAFQEMWGTPVSQKQVSTQKPTTAPGPSAPSLARHFDNKVVSPDSIVAVTGTLNGKKKTLLICDIGSSWAYPFKYSVYVDVFSGVPVFYDNVNANWPACIIASEYLSGKWKLTSAAVLPEYCQKRKIQISMESIKTGKDLRLFYEKYIPKTEQYIVPENLRMIDNYTYVEKFIINGQEKILFVYRPTTGVYSMPDDTDKFCYTYGYDFFSGTNMDNPWSLELYMDYIVNDTVQNYDETPKYYNREFPNKPVLFSKYFSKVKYKKVMTKAELIAFYKVNVPADQQFFFSKHEAFRQHATDIVDFMNMVNSTNPGTFVAVPEWKTYSELVEALKGAIKQKYGVTDEDLTLYPLFCDEEVVNALKLITFDAISGSFSISGDMLNQS